MEAALPIGEAVVDVDPIAQSEATALVVRPQLASAARMAQWQAIVVSHEDEVNQLRQSRG